MVTPHPILGQMHHRAQVSLPPPQFHFQEDLWEQDRCLSVVLSQASSQRALLGSLSLLCCLPECLLHLGPGENNKRLTQEDLGHLILTLMILLDRGLEDVGIQNWEVKERRKGGNVMPLSLYHLRLKLEVHLSAPLVVRCGCTSGSSQ